MLLWCDASDFHQFQKGCIGIVVSDDNNFIMNKEHAELSYSNNTTIVSLEYEALIYGLEFCVKNNFCITSIRIDNLMVAKHILNRHSFKNKKRNTHYNSLKAKVIHLLSQLHLSPYDIIVINREENLAHEVSYTIKTVV